jgi:hypothetical protein
MGKLNTVLFVLNICTCLKIIMNCINLFLHLFTIARGHYCFYRPFTSPRFEISGLSVWPFSLLFSIYQFNFTLNNSITGFRNSPWASCRIFSETLDGKGF